MYIFYILLFLSVKSMSKTQRHQQEALWELISTELTYINKLTVSKEVCHTICIFVCFIYPFAIKYL